MRCNTNEWIKDCVCVGVWMGGCVGVWMYAFDGVWIGVCWCVDACLCV